MFNRFARFAAYAVGHPLVFSLALLLVILWAVSGPFFGFTDTWQLVVNTLSSVVTFLVVFLIQHTQNADTEAIQLKLDELILSVHGARNSLLDVETSDSNTIEEVHREYQKLAEDARAQDSRGNGARSKAKRNAG